jgi:hypothetical protein
MDVHDQKKGLQVWYFDTDGIGLCNELLCAFSARCAIRERGDLWSQRISSEVAAHLELDSLYLLRRSGNCCTSR